METKPWNDIKDNVYGKKGTPRRDKLDREFESFKVGLMLKKASSLSSKTTPRQRQ